MEVALARVIDPTRVADRLRAEAAYPRERRGIVVSNAATLVVTLHEVPISLTSRATYVPWKNMRGTR